MPGPELRQRMAAITAVADLAPVGSSVVCQSVAYSGTRTQLRRWAESGRIQLGLGADDVAGSHAGGLPEPLWSGSRHPTNPTLEMIDIAQVAQAAHAAGALLVVDSTFATPLGTSRWIGPTSSCTSASSMVATRTSCQALSWSSRRRPGRGALPANRTLGGGIPGPMETWIALRGLRTFPLRWERSCANACSARHPRAVRRGRGVGCRVRPGRDGIGDQRPRRSA